MAERFSQTILCLDFTQIIVIIGILAEKAVKRTHARSEGKEI